MTTPLTKYRFVHPEQKLSANATWPMALDPTFNLAVVLISVRLFPNGFVVSDNAPSTYEELCMHLDAGEPMTVWSGASDNSIYDDPDINYAFRAWHDWCHWRGRLAFTPDGERAVCKMQQWHLMRLAAGRRDAVRWCRIVWAEIVAQADHFVSTGEFPADQRAFVERWLGESSTP